MNKTNKKNRTRGVETRNRLAATRGAGEEIKKQGQAKEHE